MVQVTVKRDIHELLLARNLRDVGRGVTKPVDNGDGTVSFDLSPDVLDRIAVLHPDLSLDDALRSILWRTPRLPKD